MEPSPALGCTPPVPASENREEVVNLLQQHEANGLRFTVSNYIESGDQVSATFTISGPQVPDPVNVTKILPPTVPAKR